MINFIDAVYLLLPLASGILFLLGLFSQHKNYIIASLWLSLIALILHYYASGGEILGSYFNYLHAAIYSLNLVVLLAVTIYLLFNLSNIMRSKFFYGCAMLFSTGLLGSLALLLGNLWINAYFVENRLQGTPILQVAALSKQSYCDYKYIFYKIDSDRVVRFMCPNHYGLLPSIGRLDAAPNFVVKQLPMQLQSKFESESKSL